MKLKLALGALLAALVLISPQAALAYSTVEIEAMHSKASDRLPPIAEALKFSYSRESNDEFERACAKGRAAIDRAVAALKADKPTKSLCLVSDIDETILDNRPFIKREVAKNARQVNWDAFEQWVHEADCRPLKPSIDLLAYARKKGVAVFLVTGRIEKLRRSTISNLIKAGIAYDGLYMRPDLDTSSAVPMKSAYRKKIEDMGYEIVVNIGDQFSDLAGGYAFDNEKLPNKMYFIK